ncbi:PAS domain S-box protein [Geitlerinema sp. CS-897]|nr:PAS domain S-box protein [Geitlerinema sp. CS-897]
MTSLPIAVPIFDLDRVIDRSPPCVPADFPLLEAMVLMSHRRPDNESNDPSDEANWQCSIGDRTCTLLNPSSYVLVGTPDRLEGILTERDTVRLAAEGRALDTLSVGEVMSSPLVGIPQRELTDIFAVLAKFQQHNIRHLPVLDDRRRLLGVIERGQLRELLHPVALLRLQTVRDVMQTDIVVAPPHASILELAKRMARHQVSCVLVADGLPNETSLTSPGCVEPLGIVTERDIVQFQVLQLDLTHTTAATVMSSPLHATTPPSSLWSVHQQMQHHHIRRVVVLDLQGKLAGLITQTTVLKSLDPGELYTAVGTLYDRVCRLEAEKVTLLETRNRDLERQIDDRTHQLQQERNFIAAVLDTAGAFVLVLDREGRIVRFNQTCERLTGYRFEEVRGRRPWELFLPPEQIETVRGMFAQLRGGRSRNHHVNAWVAKDGTQRVIEWSNSILTDDRGEVTYVIATGIDITERQQMEDALRNLVTGMSCRHGNAFFQSLVTYLARALQVERAFVAQLSDDGTCVRTLAQCDGGRSIENEEYFLDATPLRAAIAGRVCLVRERVRQQFPDASWLERSQAEAFAGAPLLDRAGNVLGLVAAIGSRPIETPHFVEDILNVFAARASSELERQTAERALRAEEAKFRQLTENIREVFYIFSADFRQCVYVSPTFEAVWGFDPRHLEENPLRWIDFVHPDERQALDLALQDFQTRLHFDGEYRIVRPDGELRWIRSRNFPVRDSNGRIYRIAGLAEDITERKRVAERLKQRAEFEHFLNRVARSIRQSLDLDATLKTVVTEVRQLLECDRALVYRFEEDMSGTIVAESVLPQWTSALDYHIEDTCFQMGAGMLYRLGHRRAIANVGQAGVSDCHRQLLDRFEVKANLVVPILLRADNNYETQLWGLLIAHQCSAPRAWQPSQLDLLEELAVQLSLAIQQSQLYGKLCTELTQRERIEAELRQAKLDLERRVSERTDELRRANDRLQREIRDRQRAMAVLERQNLKSHLFAQIAFKIRQSLKLEEILQTTVAELQQILGCDRVLVYRVLPNGTGGTIAEAVTPGYRRVLNWNFSEEVFPLEYQQLYGRGTVRAVADVQAAYETSTPCLSTFLQDWQVRAKLLVPVLQSEALWGFIIAHQCDGPRQWSDDELELMLQVADQLSVALSHTQLVEALENSERRFRATFEQAAVGIVLARTDGQFTRINQKFCDILGYSHEELLQKTFDDITHPDDRVRSRRGIRAVLAGQMKTFSTEKRYLRRDGSFVWGYLSVSLVRHDSGEPDYSIGVVADISDRKRAEERLKTSVAEKEVLLKEIHHRVKNNLYVISNLLELQSDILQDERTRSLFADSQNRIQTMALIHEQLYQSDDLACINFTEYLNRLVENLVFFQDSDRGNIETEIEVDPVRLNLEIAIPCGLIANELVTNAFKYAFPNRSSGQISIRVKELSQQKIYLEIGDNGIGLPETLDWKNTESLGLRLVNLLAEQLEAIVEVDRENGTVFRLTFPILPTT